LPSSPLTVPNELLDLETAATRTRATEAAAGLRPVADPPRRTSRPVVRPVLLCQTTRAQTLEAALLADVLSTRWPVRLLESRSDANLRADRALYESLAVRAPDLVLGVERTAPVDQTSAVLSRTAELLRAEPVSPWAMIVLGNTDSALGCALAAAKVDIPVVHVEAGVSPNGASVPSDLNRRLIDTLSTVLCAPSPSAAERLYREHAHAHVFHTGDLARDVLQRHATRAALPADSRWPLPPGARFVFAYLADAYDDERRWLLPEVLDALASFELPVVLPASAEAREALLRLRRAPTSPTLHLLPPLDYLAALAAIRDAAVVVTDSGRVQREAYWLGTPCVTLAWGTDWPETVREGATKLLAPQAIRSKLELVVHEQLLGRRSWDRDIFGDGSAAQRIVDSLVQIDVLAHVGDDV